LRDEKHTFLITWEENISLPNTLVYIVHSSCSVEKHNLSVLFW
jgi:hypothetical protein